MEARGMWIQASFIRDPKNVEKIVQSTKSHNFNLLIVQCVVGGYAYYDSKILPKSDYIRKYKDYDPLREFIRLCHKNNIQVHAWVNTYVIWSSEEPPKAPNHVLNLHPDWTLIDDRGIPMSGYTRRDWLSRGVEGIYLNPRLDSVKDYLTSIFLEIVSNYDVDGVHFDFVRFPGTKYGYSDIERQYFIDLHESWDPALLPDNSRSHAPERDLHRGFSPYDAWTRYYNLIWNSERAHAVTELVSRVYNEVKRIKPNVIVSAAVFAHAGTAFYWVQQVWQTWPQLGIIDLLIPMAYTYPEDMVVKLATSVKENARSRLAYIGLGAYTKPVHNIISEIKSCRAHTYIDGWVLFLDNPPFDKQAYLDTLCQHVSEDWVPAPTIDNPVVAIVDHRKVYLNEIRMIQNAGEPLRAAFLRWLDYYLLYREAYRRGYVAWEDSLYFDNLQQAFRSPSSFLNTLLTLGLDEAHLHNDLQQRIMIYKLLNDEVYRKVHISSSTLVRVPKLAEYRTFFVSLPKDSTLWLHTLKRMKLHLVLHQLQKGKDFADLAYRFSENRKSVIGGYSGIANLREDNWITSVLRTLHEGEFSPPVRTSLGLVIFKVDTIYAEEARPYGELPPHLQRTVFNELLRQRYDEFISTLRNRSRIQILLEE